MEKSLILPLNEYKNIIIEMGGHLAMLDNKTKIAIHSPPEGRGLLSKRVKNRKQGDAKSVNNNSHSNNVWGYVWVCRYYKE